MHAVIKHIFGWSVGWILDLELSYIYVCKRKEGVKDAHRWTWVQYPTTTEPSRPFNVLGAKHRHTGSRSKFSSKILSNHWYIESICQISFEQTTSTAYKTCCLNAYSFLVFRDISTDVYFSPSRSTIPNVSLHNFSSLFFYVPPSRLGQLKSVSASETSTVYSIRLPQTTMWHYPFCCIGTTCNYICFLFQTWRFMTYPGFE